MSGLSGRNGITPGVSSSEMGRGCVLAGFMGFKSGEERGEKERLQVKDSLERKQRQSRAGRRGSREGRGLGLWVTAGDCSRSSKKSPKQWLPSQTAF